MEMRMRQRVKSFRACLSLVQDGLTDVLKLEGGVW